MKDGTAKTLCELVSIASVNPAFALGDEGTGEQAVCDFMAAALAKAGIDVELRPVADGRPNLVARLLPRGGIRQRVWLVSHTDTVSGAPSQFVPQERAGRIYGRGACDAKANLAAAMAVLTDMARQPQRPSHTEICLMALADEEHGQLGARALVRSGWRADLAIVGEPTQLRVVTAHKGSLWLEFQTRGRAAHGATPEGGHNAIHEMARIVHELETEYRRTLKRDRHPLLGHATISVGTIRGGVQPNVVPDRCTMRADRRTLPGETERSVIGELARWLRRQGLRASVRDVKVAPCPPLETNPDQPLVRQFLHSAGQVGPVGADYFCDAAVLSEGGVPSVVFGPGAIAQAHTANEWVSMRALEAAVTVLNRFLTTMP